MNTTIRYARIPSERHGYTVWLCWGQYSGFLVGTVRPFNRRWQAIFDDGRRPNVRTGDKMDFKTRHNAAEWLKSVAGE